MRKSLPLPLLAAIAALPPLSIDMYLPALPGIAEYMQSETATVQNSLSIFLVGFGLGMLFFGPFSDRFGRKPLALFGLTGFALASLLLAACEQVEVFLTLRFIQGFLGSAATVVVPAIIRDTYGKDTSKGISAVGMIMMIAPLVAPLIGSALLSLAGWQLIFWFLSGYAVLLLAISLLKLPETRPVSAEVASNKSPFANYKIILARPDIYFDLLCFMLASLAFFSYLTSVSFIYIEFFEISETGFGLLFAFSAFALIVANFINIRIISRYGSRKILSTGLLAGLFFSVILAICIATGAGLLAVVISFFLIIICLGISSINADALVIIEFPHQASSASAVIGTLRFGSGALAGPILVLFHDGSPMPTAILMTTSLALACVVQLARKSLLKPENNQ